MPKMSLKFVIAGSRNTMQIHEWGSSLPITFVIIIIIIIIIMIIIIVIIIIIIIIIIIDINECSPNPCQNGATCVDLVGSYRCDCKSGYTGSNCEEGGNRIAWL